MFEALFSAIVDMLLSAAGSAIVRLFGLENASDVIMAIIGLGCIAIGAASCLLGH